MGNNTTHTVCYIIISNHPSHVMSDNDIIAMLAREAIMNLESFVCPTIPQFDNHDIKLPLGMLVP